MTWEPGFSSQLNSSKHQLLQLMSALFEPDELIEIRAIRNARNDLPAKVVLRSWMTRDELIKSFRRLRRQNQSGANLYFGVNPRQHRSGKKSAVRTVRCLWADIDSRSPRGVLAELSSNIPPPSICVGSGRGTHLYWLLKEDFSVDDRESRDYFESLLRKLYHEIGSDSTQDVSRLLRLPGFDNMKTFARPCLLVHCHETLQYTLNDFRRWTPAEDPSDGGIIGHESMQTKCEKNCNQSEFNLRLERLSDDFLNVPRIRRLVQKLRMDVPDRSRRDFAIVCELLRMGLTAEQISDLVDGHSKFASRSYTATTIANASRMVRDAQ